jgi:hypothetical protein
MSQEDGSSFNLNDECSVTLTTHGYRILVDYYSRPKMEWHLENRLSTSWSGSLWEFMSIFGHYMYNGGLQIIEQNRIEIKRRT